MVTAQQRRIQQQRAEDGAKLELAVSSMEEFCKHVRVEGESSEDNPSGIVPFVPFPWQLEEMEPLDNWEDVLWLKCRQCGGSTLAQIRCLYVAEHMPNQAIGIYSMDQDAAWEFLYDVRRMWEYLPGWLRIPLVVDNKGELEFANGSRIVTFASSPNAGSGRTWDVVVSDEMAKAAYARESYRAYRPALRRDGQFIGMATMKDVTGQFFTEVWQGSKVGRYPYRTRFIGALEVPGRDEKWWEEICREFPDEVARGMEYPLTEADAFLAVRKGLVYGNFDSDVHVTKGWSPFRWEDAKYRFAGCDFGISMPSAMVAIGVSGSGRVHVFGEFYKVGADLIEMGEWLMEWHRLKPFNQVLCDPSETAAINTLMLKFPAFGANNNRSYGISMVKHLLNKRQLTIVDSCANLIKEFGEYREGRRHDPNTRELYPTTTPVDHHADALDACRYAICGWADMEGVGDIYSGKAKFGKVVW